jgi:hypothetical protein
MAINIQGKEGAKESVRECASISWGLKVLRGTSEAGRSSDSESFEPEFHQIKKLGLKPNRKKFRSGGWSAYEN